MRAALILLASVVFGCLAGVLTYLSERNTAAAALAALAGTGVSVPTLHTLISR
ncbi:hypothetical protein LRE75_34530 [Streptomyces sp. 372A]